MNENKELTKKNKTIIIIEFVLLIVLVVGIPLYLFLFQKDFIAEFKDVDALVAILNKNKLTGTLIYLGLMMFQIIVSIIPGQVFQIAAGFVYGFWFGLLITIVGAALGTAITYWISRLLGKNAVHMIFGEEKIQYYTKILNSKKAYIIIFLVYVIPGIPKDLMSYAAGISSIKFRPFITLAVIGRIPGIIGSLLIGSMYFQGNYTVVIIIGIIAVILFTLGIIFRKKLFAFLDKRYDAMTK